jgi:DNA-binding transcriptional LysR family regulator
MELRHLRYFLAVAEELNFTRAAARLGIGQPPLSQQIKDLEAEIGTALFRRVPHGAELTAAGQAFRAAVEGFPAQIDRAVSQARRAGRGEVGALRVGFTAAAFLNPLVPGAVRSFRSDYPDVELTLDEAHTTELIAMLTEDVLDAVFVRAISVVDKAVQLRPLGEESMVAVVPDGHRAAASVALDLADLRDDPFIFTPRSVGVEMVDVVVAACRRAGFEPIHGQVAPQLTSVINLVAAGLGVAIVPLSMRQLQVGGVVFREIRDAVPVISLSLAYRRGETSTIIRNFIGLVGAASSRSV